MFREPAPSQFSRLGLHLVATTSKPTDVRSIQFTRAADYQGTWLEVVVTRFYKGCTRKKRAPLEAWVKVFEDHGQSGSCGFPKHSFCGDSPDKKNRGGLVPPLKLLMLNWYPSLYSVWFCFQGHWWLVSRFIPRVHSGYRAGRCGTSGLIHIHRHL